jgi:hypothetical protein
VTRANESVRFGGGDALEVVEIEGHDAGPREVAKAVE